MVAAAHKQNMRTDRADRDHTRRADRCALLGRALLWCAVPCRRCVTEMFDVSGGGAPVRSSRRTPISMSNCGCSWDGSLPRCPPSPDPDYNSRHTDNPVADSHGNVPCIDSTVCTGSSECSPEEEELKLENFCATGTRTPHPPTPQHTEWPPECQRSGPTGISGPTGTALQYPPACMPAHALVQLRWCWR